jgi:Tfp pilus assembly protein PilF
MYKDNRSKGVYFEKTGDVKIEGDVVGGDQTNYHQYFGQESPLTAIFKVLDSAIGWSEAPPEARQQIGRRVWWSVRYIYRTHPRFWRVTLTSILLLPLLWLFWWQPALVTWLNVRGTAMIEAGEYTQASQYLERATSLQPDDARTHYNLGNAYDLLPNNQSQAMAEYETTIRLDDRFWPAYNNLARLRILTGNPEAALELLQAGLRVESAMPTREEAIFQKNIGWAYLGQMGRQECPFPENASVQTPQMATAERALTHLGDAQIKIQTIRETGESVSIYLAEIYRLQGCAYEALGQQEAARRAWSDSLAHALTVLGSEFCAASGPWMFDCIRAETWATVITDRLRER